MNEGSSVIIKTVTVIGVTGTMGANIAGIFASFGDGKVYCVGRDIEKVKKTPKQKLHNNMFYGASHQEEIVISLLSKYLSKRELTYYMAMINQEARQSQDCYTQIIQVIQEKEKQNKFCNSTKQYKRNNIIEYALQINLKEYYGWSITPPKDYKKVYKEQELFTSK